MRRFQIGRPSGSMVISTVALFVALGGVGFAAATLDGKRATLKSGKTMKGVYSVQDFESGVGQGQFAGASISYPAALREAPKLRFIAEGQTPPAKCPGSVQNPKAARGNLCVYENSSTSRDPGDVAGLYGDNRDRYGFVLAVLSAAAQGGLYQSEGSWAVTAR